MGKRLALSLSFLTFIICLLVGAVDAENPFSTTVYRALVAMGATMVLGLILGWIAEKMVDENLDQERKKLEKMPTETPAGDR